MDMCVCIFKIIIKLYLGVKKYNININIVDEIIYWCKICFSMGVMVIVVCIFNEGYIEIMIWIFFFKF